MSQLNTATVTTPWTQVPMSAAAARDARLAAIDHAIADTMEQAGDQPADTAWSTMQTTLRQVAAQATPTRADAISVGQTLLDMQQVAQNGTALGENQPDAERREVVLGQALCDADILDRTTDASPAAKFHAISTMVSQAAARASALSGPEAASLVLLQACTDLRTVGDQTDPRLSEEQQSGLDGIHAMADRAVRQAQETPEKAFPILFGALWDASRVARDAG